jgi:hypothetical protein
MIQANPDRMNTYLSEESRGIACAPLHIDEILCFVDGSIQCAMEKIHGHCYCCPHTTATKASTLPSSVEGFRIMKWQATRFPPEKKTQQQTLQQTLHTN